MTANGSIVGWGYAGSGAFSGLPTGTGFTAVAGGEDGGLALTANGSIVAWGNNGGSVSGAPTGTGFVGVGGDGLTDFALVPNATATPEPASVTLLGIGIASMAGYGWRRRRNQAVAAREYILLRAAEIDLFTSRKRERRIEPLVVQPSLTLPARVSIRAALTNNR